MQEADNVGLFYLQGQGMFSVLEDQPVNAEVRACENLDAAQLGTLGTGMCLLSCPQMEFKVRQGCMLGLRLNGLTCLPLNREVCQ